MCSGIAIAVNWGVYIYAVNSGHILDASLAYYLNPLMVIALGFFLFKEKLAFRQWLAIAVAALGILIAIVAYGEVPVFAIVIGTSFAVYGAIKKNVKCNGLISTFVEAAFLTPFALAYILWAEMGHVGAVGTLEGMQFLLIPMSGVVTSIPLLLFSIGVAKVSMSLTGILMYINPTLQFMIGALLYHETFDDPVETYSVIILLCCKLHEIVPVLRCLAVKLHPHGAVSCDDVKHRLFKSFHFHCCFCRIIKFCIAGFLCAASA